MYSGCDKLSQLQILFVYFLTLPSLLHPSILFNCFLYLLLFFFIALRVVHDCHEFSSMPPSWLVLWNQKRLGMRLRIPRWPDMVYLFIVNGTTTSSFFFSTSYLSTSWYWLPQYNTGKQVLLIQYVSAILWVGQSWLYWHVGRNSWLMRGNTFTAAVSEHWLSG